MQLMIRDNKVTSAQQAEKAVSTHTVIIIVVKPNSQANRINATTPSKAAAMSTRRTGKKARKKSKPQPHYTQQADPGNSNRKPKSKAQSNANPHPHFRQLLICFRRQILCKHNSTA